MPREALKRASTKPDLISPTTSVHLDEASAAVVRDELKTALAANKVRAGDRRKQGCGGECVCVSTSTAAGTKELPHHL